MVAQNSYHSQKKNFNPWLGMLSAITQIASIQFVEIHDSNNHVISMFCVMSPLTAPV